MSQATLESSAAHSAAAHPQGQVAHNENLKFAMWLFLASEVVIFSVLIITFAIFSLNNREVVKEVHEATGVILVAINTFLLLTSSWTMVMGLHEIRKGNRQGLIRWIGATAVLGMIFVALQYVEYSALAHEGVTINTGFGSRFYAPTTLHGAHVIAGVIWALLVVRHALRGGYQTNPIGVEIFGLYWHFVDVIWIVIFTVVYLI